MMNTTTAQKLRTDAEIMNILATLLEKGFDPQVQDLQIKINGTTANFQFKPKD